MAQRFEPQWTRKRLRKDILSGKFSYPIRDMDDSSNAETVRIDFESDDDDADENYDAVEGKSRVTKATEPSSHHGESDSSEWSEEDMVPLNVLKKRRNEEWEEEDVLPLSRLQCALMGIRQPMSFRPHDRKPLVEKWLKDHKDLMVFGKEQEKEEDEKEEVKEEEEKKEQLIKLED